MIAFLFLTLLGIYVGCGLLFALFFSLWGTVKIDKHAVNATWGFRLLVIPGATALWPWLLARWLRSVHTSPDDQGTDRRVPREQP